MDPAFPLNTEYTAAPDDIKDSVATDLIPVIEERLRIEKRVVETGRVLIQKQVNEHEETVTVPLNHDDVNVERVLVNRYVDSPPAVRYEGDTMIIPVLEEVVVVEKRLMLVEELHVTRRVIQTQDTQQVTLRKETVTVTRQPGSATDATPEFKTN